jgi:TetR/AcrR family transcriptional regulator, cholesterol catabolism regulator
MAKRTNLGKRRAAAAADSSAFYSERRQAIIDGAARVFQKRGYEAATLGDIANDLKLDRATLYYYASSKQELLTEVLRQASDANIKTVETIAAGAGKAADKLRAAVTALIESYDSSYPYLQLFLQQFLQSVPADATDLRGESRDWAARYYRGLRAILQQGVESGEFAVDIPIGIATISVIGAVNWVQATGMTGSARRRTLGKKALAPRAIGQGLADFIIGGLAGKAR